MRHEPTGIAKRIWLLLLREGGRWSAAEIGEKLGDDCVSAAQNLASMVSFGTVRRFEPVGKDRVRWGITPDCKVPRGVSVSDIIACDLGRME